MPVPKTYSLRQQCIIHIPVVTLPCFDNEGGERKGWGRGGVQAHTNRQTCTTQNLLFLMIYFLLLINDFFIGFVAIFQQKS